MTAWNFKDANLKVARAIRHIEVLNQRIVEFFKTDFYKLSIEEDTYTGNNTAKLSMTSSVPEDIPLIIGDAIHNLRTALDFIAYAIVSSNNAYFPFHETREKLIAAIEKGKIEIAKIPRIKTLILDTIKPYKSGNYSLWALNRLDRVDKHKLLIPIVAVTQISGVCIEDDKGNRFENLTMIVNRNNVLHSTGTLGKKHIKSHGHVKSYGQPSFSLFFGNIEVFEGKPIVSTLNQLAAVVNSTIGMFEAH